MELAVIAVMEPLTSESAAPNAVSVDGVLAGEAIGVLEGDGVEVGV